MVSINDIKDVHLFLNCNEHQLREACRHIEKVLFKEKSFIYKANEKSSFLYIVHSGAVELLLPMSNNKTHTSSILRKNDVFGIGEIFFDYYYLDAKTLTSSTLFRIRKSTFFSHFLINHCIALNVLTDFAHIIKIAATQSKWDNSKSNVVAYLVSYCKKHGRQIENTLIANFTMTHEEIAHILNLSREHVSRIIKELKKEEVIIINKSTLKITIDKAQEITKENDIMSYMKF